MTTDPGAVPKQSPSAAVEARPSMDSGLPTEPVPQVQSDQGRGQLWVRRMSMLLFVTLSAVVGVVLVLLPWSLQWTANRLLWSYPDLRAAIGNGFVRGVCSGLGILNLWNGFREAVHYHEGHGAAK